MTAKMYISKGDYDVAKKKLTIAENLYKQYQAIYETER